MFYVVIAAVLLLSARIAAVYKKNILDTAAISGAGLIMVLYLLAFFRLMKGSAVMAALVILYVIVRTAVEGRGRKGAVAENFTALLAQLGEPMLILFVLTIIGVTAATSHQVFTWWDDINFWSSDAKQLFYMSGFPGRYGNVSPEFGDYPPVTSIFKWLFLSLSPSVYNESLQFAGYFALNAVFLLPLLARIKSYLDGAGFTAAERTVLKVLSFATVMLLPGVFNGIIYYGTPADVTMAIVYGALLLAVYDQYGHGDLFYFGRIGLYTSVLLLSKSVGFEWALFALIFYLVMGKRDKKIWISLLMAACSYGSWLLFCLVNRRVAKLTGASLRMASGSYSAPDNTADKLRYFIEGFCFEPMHSDYNPTIDLSTGTVVLMIFAGIFVLYYRNILGRNELKKISLFTLATGLVSYGIVFIAHISIFQTEDQYLDAYAMGISIARYCAPFALGMSYLLLGILFNRLRARTGGKYKRLAVIVMVLLIFLTADYSGVYKHLKGYRKDAADSRAQNEEMVGQDGRSIVEAVSDPVYYGRRVLVLRDRDSFKWVHHAYISKEASPVPLVYDVYEKEDTPESLAEKIRASHAEYLLVEDESGSARDLFSQVMGDAYQAGVPIKINGNIH